MKPLYKADFEAEFADNLNRPLYLFDFSNELRRIYTEGGCHILAQIIRKRIPGARVISLYDYHHGATLVQFDPSKDDIDIMHDLAVDVEGVWPLPAFVARWEAFMDTCGPDDHVMYLVPPEEPVPHRKDALENVETVSIYAVKQALPIIEYHFKSFEFSKETSTNANQSV